MADLVSVIIPVYRTPLSVLRNCVESLKRQQGNGLLMEAIIIFDGNPQFDSTVVEAWSSPSVAIRTATIEHAGVSAARNEGIGMVSGQWVMFVDGDDVLPDHAVERLLGFARTCQCDVVMGAYRSVLDGAPNGETEERHYLTADKVFNGEERDAFCLDMLRPQKGIALVWGKLYAASVVHGIQGFDESLSLGEDAEYAFRACMAAKRIGYVDSMAYEYRRNAESAVRTFRADYVQRTMAGIKALNVTVARIDQPALREQCAECLDNYALFHLTIIMINYLFNPNAPWNHSERKKQYRRTLNLPIFRMPLRRYHGGRFPLTRQAALFSMKWHLYCVSAAIAWVRHRQFGD